MDDYSDMPMRWGVTFLNSDTRFSHEERLYLLLNATEMYLSKEEIRRVKTDFLEGTISTEGKYGVIGMFGGVQFDATVESDHGVSDISFLVSEQTTRGAFTISIRDYIRASKANMN